MPLTFTIDKPASWICYSVDGQQNVTIVGNTTLAILTGGLHNVRVYANDTFGNVGVSEQIDFTIILQTDTKSELFPTLAVATVSIVAVALVIVVLLVYYKKHKR